MKLIVNGKKFNVEGHPLKRLLDVLREDLKLTGTKEGCGEGECGACSVILNGRVVNSCLIPFGQLRNGDRILTIEGIQETDEGRRLREAFVSEGGVQCGFCTPGILIAAYALLKEKPNPTLSEIKEAVAGNLCRCTGYVKIIKSIERAVSERSI